MSKLIYAVTSLLLEENLNYANILSNVTTYNQPNYNPAYYSIAFTGDGYLYTHGLKFRLHKINTHGAPEGLNFAWDNRGYLQLLDGTNEVASIDALRYIDVEKNGKIAAVRGTGADYNKYTLSHTKPQISPAGTYGYVQNATETNIKIPGITVDAYGHVTAVSQSSSFDITKVKASEIANDDNANYYLIGVTNGNLQSPKYKSVHIDKNGDLYIGGNKAVTFNDKASDSAFGIVELYDGIDGGPTSNNVQTLLNTSRYTAATPWAVHLALLEAINHADSLFATNDAMVLAGTVNSSGVISNPNTAVLGSNLASNATVALIDYKSGYTFKITDSGNLTIGSGANAATFAVEAGDILLCVNSKTGGTAKGSDFTVIQNNIEGALYSSGDLTGVVFGTGSHLLSALSNPTSGIGFLQVDASNTNNPLSWVSKESLWRTFYNGSTSGSSISNKNIILKTATSSNATDPAFAISFGEETPHATITYTINTTKLLSAATSLTLSKGGTSFVYNPSDSNGKTLTIGNGLALTSATNNSVTTYNLDHLALTTSTGTNGILGKVEVDSYGHVTGIDPIKNLYFGLLTLSYDSLNIVGTYNGGSTFGLTLSAGSDITIQSSSKSNSNGLFYNSTSRTTEGIDFLIGVIHKYRPISYTNDGTTTTLILLDTSNTALKLIAGSNITLQHGIETINNLTVANGELTISAEDTWREVDTYKIGGTVQDPTLVCNSIGQTLLQFSNDFISTSGTKTITVPGVDIPVNVNYEEVSLVWTEIDDSGNVTYSV